MLKYLQVFRYSNLLYKRKMYSDGQFTVNPTQKQIMDFYSIYFPFM